VASEERILVVPFRRIKRARRTRRAKKAINFLRDFVYRHAKMGDRRVEKVKISNEVNERIWNRGREKIPSKLRVRVELKEEGGERIAWVYLGD